MEPSKAVFEEYGQSGSEKGKTSLKKVAPVVIVDEEYVVRDENWYSTPGYVTKGYVNTSGRPSLPGGLLLGLSPLVK